MAETTTTVLKCNSRKHQKRLISNLEPPSLDQFKSICAQSLDKERYPLCSSVYKNIPVYDANIDLQNNSVAEALADEFFDILLAGSGVFVLKGMYQDQELLHSINRVYRSILDTEKSSAKGDHFGENGANDRIWNSFEKHGRIDPESFFEYYSNPWLALVCEAWLGAGFRVTAQVNSVGPGGAAQMPHRDYHLGFLDSATCAKYPLATQVASQHLTLQGAIAHSDMPLNSGPTRLLPFSQMFQEGYMAYRRPEFSDFFLKNWVSVPLEVGDGLFFNPALFHAAGANQTVSFHRVANLIQASSAFGRAMEAVSTLPLVENSWAILKERYDREGTSLKVQAFIAAVADGYPFPTNLDKRPPRPGGKAPASEQDVLKKALEERWSMGDVIAELRVMKMV